MNFSSTLSLASQVNIHWKDYLCYSCFSYFFSLINPFSILLEAKQEHVDIVQHPLVTLKEGGLFCSMFCTFFILSCRTVLKDQRIALVHENFVKCLQVLIRKVQHKLYKLYWFGEAFLCGEKKKKTSRGISCYRLTNKLKETGRSISLTKCTALQWWNWLIEDARIILRKNHD